MNRPIVFFDLETTGVDTGKDKIVEIFCLKFPSEERFYYKINPEMHIPEGASEVHGISDADVAEAPTFKDIASELMEFISGCDLAGYNSIRFDIPLLYNEFKRCGMTLDYRSIRLIDACNIYRQKEPHTLTKAVEFYLNESHEDAHAASADVEATYKVFFQQCLRYGLTDLDEIAALSNYNRKILDLSGKFTTNEDDKVVFTFGKWMNQPALEHKDYLRWMLGGEFNSDTKELIVEMLRS